MKKTLVTALTLAMAAPMVLSSVANAEEITILFSVTRQSAVLIRFRNMKPSFYVFNRIK